MEEYMKKLEGKLWNLEGQTPFMEKQDKLKVRKFEDLE